MITLNELQNEFLKASSSKATVVAMCDGISIYINHPTKYASFAIWIIGDSNVNDLQEVDITMKFNDFTLNHVYLENCNLQFWQGITAKEAVEEFALFFILNAQTIKGWKNMNNDELKELEELIDVFRSMYNVPTVSPILSEDDIPEIVPDVATEKKCECGAAKCGGLHSSWCPLA